MHPNKFEKQPTGERTGGGMKQVETNLRQGPYGEKDDTCGVGESDYDLRVCCLDFLWKEIEASDKL